MRSWDHLSYGITRPTEVTLTPLPTAYLPVLIYRPGRMKVLHVASKWCHTVEQWCLWRVWYNVPMCVFACVDTASRRVEWSGESWRCLYHWWLWDSRYEAVKMVGELTRVPLSFQRPSLVTIELQLYRLLAVFTWREGYAKCFFS